MKRVFLLFVLLLTLSTVGIGQGTGPITVREVDGSPVCRNCRTFIFGNGSLTVSGNTVTVSGGGGGSGDVVGPALATDNAIVRFDSTTGKLIQNSVVTIGDTGNVAGIVNLTFTGVLTGGSAPTTITDSTGKILSAALNDVQFANFVAAPSAGFVGATGAGDYAHRTPAQVTAALDNLVGDSGSGGTKGLVPAPASGDAAKFLKGDGTWATVSASPGGSSTQLQYNNSGALGGISTFTTDGSVVTMTRASVGTGTTTGIELANTTAAAAGSQQFSPCLVLTGQGWKTNATAGSQSTNWCIQARPVQGTANPTVNLALLYQVNGGGYADATATGQVLVPGGASASQSAPQLSSANNTSYGIVFGGGNAGNAVSLRAGGGIISVDANVNTVGVSANFDFLSTPAGHSGRLARLAASSNVLQLADSSGASPGSFLTAYQHLTKTGNYTVVANDSNAFFDNAGAGAGVTFTLPTPTASPSLKYTFCRVANQTVTVDIGGSVTIRSGASVTTAGGNVTLDAVGSCLMIFSVSSTEWYASASNGTLTFN